MPKNTNNLPYFKIRRKTEEKILADFLLRKFRPKIKEEFPQHYLIQHIPFKILNFIKETSKKYPYFLRFDIRLYYPSINHQILLKKLPKICPTISRRFKIYLKKDIPEFLSQSPYGKGLPIGSRLSYILANIFLLDLGLKIKTPFLCQNDDYLIFCKNKGEPEKLLKNIIVPKIQELELEINEKKLTSGKFHQDRVNFIGFDFFAGYFTISEEKIEEFKKKIIKITHLTKKKPGETIIKSLNNKILGFGYYYKFAAGREIFKALDAFIRMRLRRWITRHKDRRNKEGNLFLTNQVFRQMGLKSLTEIREKYTRKKRLIFRKTHKNKTKSSTSLSLTKFPKLNATIDRIWYYSILKELKEITKRLTKLERNITRIERKLHKT